MPEFFEETVRLLPIGRGSRGHQEVCAHAIVLNDTFTARVLLPRLWHLEGDGPRYAISNIIRQDGNRRTRRLHRFVYEHYHGHLPDGVGVDHIDRNPLNNLPTNLRLVSQSINTANSNKRRTNTSGFKGVMWYKQTRRWHAQITVNYKQLHLGFFLDIRDAARAVNAAYRIHFPEVAIPNPEVESAVGA